MNCLLEESISFSPVPEAVLVTSKSPVISAPESDVSKRFVLLKYNSTLELANATIDCSPVKACSLKPLLLFNNCI